MKQTLFLVMTVISCNSQELVVDEGQVNPQLEFFESKVAIPAGFEQTKVTLVEVDQKKAYLFRYEKPVNRGLLQEHFSFIVTANAPYCILGFTRMDSKYLDGELLTEEQTREIATAFLRGIDSELAESLNNLWIDKHGEPLIVDREQREIFGMKYKCYRKSSEDYSWVIVGFDGSVITFERDIVWDNEAGKRITQKWLHDSWVLENEKKQQHVKG